MADKELFTAGSVKHLDVVLQEQLEIVSANFRDNRFDRTAKRSIQIDIDFEPIKDSPDEIMCLIRASSKVPKQLRKIADVSLDPAGKFHVWNGPEPTPLFDDNVLPMTKDGDR